jgi:hypothetical protein
MHRLPIVHNEPDELFQRYPTCRSMNLLEKNVEKKIRNGQKRSTIYRVHV